MPTLGPVHPQAVTASLFADLIEVAGTGRLLPYDKDRRWTDRKDEQVLPEAIIQEPGLAITGRASCIRVYIYCRQPQGALNQAAERQAAPRAARRREGAVHLVPAARQ
jgi:hypothetical protein